MADFTGQRNGPDYTVDIPKAKKKLTLADLAAANGGVPRRVDSADPGVGGDPVAEANAFLAKKSIFDRPSFGGTPGAAEMVEPPAQKAWREANAAMGHDIAQERKGGLRRFTESANQLGDVANIGALATAPASVFGVPEPAMALGAMGGLLKLADPLRRAYLPQSDETEPGVGEAIQTGVNLTPFLGLGSTAGRIGAESMAGSRVPRGIGPSLYDSGSGPLETLNPNFQEVNPRGYLDQLLERLNGSKTADRSVRNIGNLQQEAPGGLSDVASGRVGPPGYHGPETDLSPLLEASNLARKQARAKSFRTNTPLAEGF